MRSLADRFAAILPRGRNVGGIAYAGVVLAVTAENMLRALTIPIAVIAVLAFRPQRLMPAFAGRFLGWFAWWQLPLLLVFMTFALFLDWRYAMVFALLATIPAVFALDALGSAASSGAWRLKFLLAAAVAAIVIPAFVAIPKMSKLDYLRDAGNWIRQTVPANA